MKIEIKKYLRRLEANRGYNFEYWNDEKHAKLLENGYEVYTFVREKRRDLESTSSVSEAKEVVQQLRKTGNFARIVCGYDQNQQRQKRFTVIYKPKRKAD
jgi:hypothetical protein